MQRTLFLLGSLLSLVGATLIAANLVMSYMGLATSYNLGDAAKFQFILVPLWQIGLAIAVAGGACLVASRRLARTRP
jgi:uncharacterized membrane protein